MSDYVRADNLAACIDCGWTIHLDAQYSDDHVRLTGHRVLTQTISTIVHEQANVYENDNDEAQRFWNEVRRLKRRS